MAEKLLRYRKEKEKQQLRQDLYNSVHKIYSNMTNSLTGLLANSTQIDAEINESENAVEQEENNLNKLKMFMIFTFWISGYVYFIYVEFGAVYFCITALIFLYYNTRTTRKLKDEISAYSVFNENCEKIDGTFSAEQIDKQIRSGMM